MGFFASIKAIMSSQYRNYYTALMDFRRSCKYKVNLTEDLAKRVIKHFYPNEKINETFFKQALDNANTSSAKNNVSIAPKQAIDEETCKLLINPNSKAIAKYYQALYDLRKSYANGNKMDISLDIAKRTVEYYYPGEEVIEGALEDAIKQITNTTNLSSPAKKTIDGETCRHLIDPNYIPMDSKAIDKYYQVLYDLRRAFFGRNNKYEFSYDVAVGVVNHFYPNEEILEEILQRAIEYINGESDLSKEVKNKIDYETCIKLLYPNLEEVLANGIDGVLETLGKYRDYSLDVEITKLLNANGINISAPIELVFAELDKRLRKYNQTIANRLVSQGKTNLYFRGKRDERASMLWGAAYRISRLASTPIENHTPISKEEWYELFKTIPSVAKSLEGLSPEGFEKELDHWIRFNFDPLGPEEGKYDNLSFDSFAKGNSLAYDISLYMAYCELYKENDDKDLSLDHILDVLLDKAHGLNR